LLPGFRKLAACRRLSHLPGHIWLHHAQSFHGPPNFISYLCTCKPVGGVRRLFAWLDVYAEFDGSKRMPRILLTCPRWKHSLQHKTRQSLPDGFGLHRFCSFRSRASDPTGASSIYRREFGG
jgi:hypothetical protein